MSKFELGILKLCGTGDQAIACHQYSYPADSLPDPSWYLSASNSTVM